MIIGIGCDTADHKIAVELQWKTEKKLLRRVFSFEEIEIYLKYEKISFLTGRFAAKEAILKCLGTGMYDGISLNEIEILQLENGKPVIQLNGEVQKLSYELGVKNWFVSISHTTSSSMAYVIAEG